MANKMLQIISPTQVLKLIDEITNKATTLLALLTFTL